MSKTHIFITGGAGCIGHYIVSALQADPNNHLHLLIRSPNKLSTNLSNKPNTTIYPYDIADIDQVKDVLANADYLIHIATNWGNSSKSMVINIDKTLQLLSYLSPNKCQKIIYFSTASILGPNNQALHQAKEFGTPYIKSKYIAYQKLQAHPLQNKIITLFPTLVFGGNTNYPSSHISSGLKSAKHWIKWLKWIWVDGTFHFIHAEDVATITKAILSEPIKTHNIVLGNQSISVKSAMKVLCTYFNERLWFQIKCPSFILHLLAKLSQIQLNKWDKYCLKNPHFKYNTIDLKEWKITLKYPTLQKALDSTKTKAEIPDALNLETDHLEEIEYPHQRSFE